jgi:ATP-dependent protease ClpP protease subunit
MWTSKYVNRKRKRSKYLKLANNDDSSDSENEESCGNDSKMNIYSTDNHIYFYSGVSHKSCFTLNKEIRKVTLNMMNLGIRYSIDPPPIYLHIKSDGGCVFSAISTIDTITNNKVPIYSIIEGSAASAGTLISVVAKKRFISKNAFMLIHQLSSGFWGKMSEIKDDFKNNEELMKFIRQIYLTHTKVSKKTINELLEHDIYWNAEKCVSLKLVDEILS